VGPLIAGAALGFWATGTVFVAGTSIALIVVLLGLVGPLQRSGALTATTPQP
jgi:hypothetical protein